MDKEIEFYTSFINTPVSTTSLFYEEINDINTLLIYWKDLKSKE